MTKKWKGRDDMEWEYGMREEDKLSTGVEKRGKGVNEEIEFQFLPLGKIMNAFIIRSD